MKFAGPKSSKVSGAPIVERQAKHMPATDFACEDQRRMTQANAAPPADDPRGGRGAAAIRLHGLSTSRPRRRFDPRRTLIFAQDFAIQKSRSRHVNTALPTRPSFPSPMIAGMTPYAIDEISIANVTTPIAGKRSTHTNGTTARPTRYKLRVAADKYDAVNSPIP